MTTPRTGPGVVIVGGGQAGIQAAATLVESAPHLPVTIVAAETPAPYQRPPLSKYLWTEDLTQLVLPLRPQQFFSSPSLSFRGGETVTEIDRQRKRLILGGGESLDYQALILATGARPRRLAIPGVELRNVHYLRTLVDASHLRETLSGVRRLVVIGGGFIGLEIAAAGAAQGVEVTVLEAASRVLERALSPEASAWLGAWHATCGVDLRLQTTVREFKGDNGRVVAVLTADGEEIPADAVVVGIGSFPDVALAEQAGLSVEDGVVVDEYLRTSEPHIWAAGDCVRYRSRHAQAVVRVESVQNAGDQARCAARNLTASIEGGELEPYAAVPWFWSHQHTLKIQIAGIADPSKCQIVRRHHRDDKFSLLLLREGRVVAVESFNSPADHMAGRKLVADAVRIDPQRAADPTQPLKHLGSTPSVGARPAAWRTSGRDVSHSSVSWR